MVKPKLTDFEKNEYNSYCSECYAGQVAYITAFLVPKTNNSNNTKVCNCCGAHFTKTENIWKYDKTKSLAQLSSLTSRFSDMDIRTDSLVRPTIISILWTLTQLSLSYSRQYPLTIIGTNYPLFFSYGIHNIAIAFGARISATSIFSSMYQDHLKWKNMPSKLSIEIVDGNIEMAHYLYITDILTDKDMELMNYAKAITLCISDRRSRSNKNASPPKVFSIIN